MKPITELTNVTGIKEIDKDNVILYFDNALSTIADKNNFSKIYDNIFFADWRCFDDMFYLVKRQVDGLWTLIYKQTGAFLNKDLWFNYIENFNDEFFIITSSENHFKTLIYKKMENSSIQMFGVVIGKYLTVIT